MTERVKEQDANVILKKNQLQNYSFRNSVAVVVVVEVVLVVVVIVVPVP